MQQKEKQCKNCNLPKKLFSKGLCLTCHKLLYPEKYRISRGNSGKIKTSQSTIKKTSDRQKERLKKYALLRDEYLRTHPVCEVLGCIHKSTEIHHKGGRDGDNLFNYLLAVCRDHHQEIELNPLWAKKEGYSISRL